MKTENKDIAEKTLKSTLLSIPVLNSKITLFLTVVIAITGTFFFYFLPKQENPDIAVPVAMITTIYPGASLNDIEQLITVPIENAVNEIPDFDKVESYSFNSGSIVVISLTNDANVEKSWQELRRVIGTVQKNLPKDVEQPVIDTKLIETAGMIISFSGESYNYEQLAAFAEVFQKKLSRIKGVTRFDLAGKIPREIKIEVDIAELQKYPLSIDNIAQLIEAQNISIPSGGIRTQHGYINVSISRPYSTLKSIENTILLSSQENGSALRLSDIANISIKEKSDAKLRIRQKGKNAVLLSGYFQPNKNIIHIGKKVRKVINEIKKDFPEDLIIDEVSFEPESIDKSISNFMMNLLQGIGFVFLVVLVALGFRNALVVSTAIPLSILLTYIAMWFLHIKVHQISTTALIIALGLLVDNAIVVVEAVQEHLNNGKQKHLAAYLGAKETALPILAATLTTIAAFSPLLFLPGAAGDLLGAIPQIVILSLIASYLVAMLIIPALTVLLSKKSNKTKIRRNYLKKIFLTVLDKALKRKILTLGISSLVLIVSLFFISLLKKEYFPPADKDVLYIDVFGVQYDIDKTEAIVTEIEQFLSQQPEVHNYTSSVGKPLPRFYQLMEVNVPSQEYAQIKVDFNLKKGKRYSNKKELAAHLQKQFDENIVGASVVTRLLSLSGSGGGQVKVNIAGENLTRNIEVAKALRDKLRSTEGTEKVGTTIASLNYEYFANIDFDLASSLGLNHYEVQRQINLALMGGKVSEIRTNGKEIPIQLKGNIKTIYDLENLGILSSTTNHKTLLKQVADISLRKEFPVIRRKNKERSIIVYCDASEGFGAAEIADKIEFEILPKLNTLGTEISFSGEREESKKDSGNLGLASLAAIFLVYIILMLQFNSFAQPFVILFTLPLAFIGSVIGLLVTGQPLSFTAILGIASLIGIVVNDAILLLTFINRAKKQGMSIIDACKDSSNKRFVPIMVTTATTVMALIPLSLAGSEMFTPMAVSLMAGLIVATLLTLVIVPLLYSILIKR
jgi:multidrug efflux pump subunit AcrB